MPPKAAKAKGDKRKGGKSNDAGGGRSKIPKKDDKNLKADAGNVRLDSPGVGQREHEEIMTASKLNKIYLVTVVQAKAYYAKFGHTQESYNDASAADATNRALDKANKLAADPDYMEIAIDDYDFSKQWLALPKSSSSSASSSSSSSSSSDVKQAAAPRSTTRHEKDKEDKLALAAVAAAEKEADEPDKKSPSKKGARGNSNKGKAEVQEQIGPLVSTSTTSTSSATTNDNKAEATEGKGEQKGEEQPPTSHVPYATWWQTAKTILPTAEHFPPPTGLKPELLTLKGVTEMGLIRPVSLTQISKVEDAFVENDGEFDPTHPV